MRRSLRVISSFQALGFATVREDVQEALVEVGVDVSLVDGETDEGRDDALGAGEDDVDIRLVEARGVV